MGFFKSLRAEFIDIIEWIDSTQNTIVNRFERHENEIKSGAQLIVRESQVAVFIENGQFADIFQPGKYTLTTDNLPILSTLKGWKHGFDSPFKSEVYFLNTKNFTNLTWGTPNPIPKRDAEFGVIQIRAFGSYTTRVTDPVKFLKEISGTDGNFTIEEIDEQLMNFVIPAFSDALAESKILAFDLIANLNELSAECNEKMTDVFSQYGLSINNFLITNINFPEEIQDALNKRASMAALGDLNAYQKYQTGKSLEDAANNASGGGEGLSMGMGIGMASQMMNQQSQQSQNSAAGPPPLPTEDKYFVAVNGQQTGPFLVSELAKMIASQSFSSDSLVWKDGMSSWIKAEEIDALKKLFGSSPPPIPM